MSRLEISIPNTSTSRTPSPHTVYHLTLRLPLRSFTLDKRYSDFTTLHGQLSSEAGGAAPPASLPPKSYISSTLRNPALAESRRQGLEAYLRAINDAPDPRWRATSAWRSFLHLPGSTGGGGAPALHAAATAPSAPISDPVAWLDTHRELQGHLRSARTALANREDANTASSFSEEAPSSPAAAHEAAAQAKKHLSRASGLMGPLDKGLMEHGAEWSRMRLGDGEVRRRRDLLAAARREMESLEGLASLVRRKGDVDGVVQGFREGDGMSEDKKALLKQTGPTQANHHQHHQGVGKGRVLGKETARTKALDNAGVLQLQQQLMKEQDEDVNTLAQAVRRQRELGEQIAQELAVQNDMLGLLDEDVDRVEGKLKVARKRVDKIS